MTDIVERLRTRIDPWCEEAAAEIERLRREAEQHLYAYQAQFNDVGRLRAALKRLMDQPTMHPLAMTPDQRKELWAAHAEARAALESKP